jgi:hypothetical protein
MKIKIDILESLNLIDNLTKRSISSSSFLTQTFHKRQGRPLNNKFYSIVLGGINGSKCKLILSPKNNLNFRLKRRRK